MTQEELRNRLTLFEASISDLAADEQIVARDALSSMMSVVRVSMSGGLGGSATFDCPNCGHTLTVSL